MNGYIWEECRMKSGFLFCSFFLSILNESKYLRILEKFCSFMLTRQGNCESGDRLPFIKMDTQWDETHSVSSLDNVQYSEATETIHSLVWMQNEIEKKNLSFPLLLLEALINRTTYNSLIICTNCQYYEYWASEKIRCNVVQWITNSVHSTNEHYFPYAKYLPNIREKKPTTRDGR